MFMPLHTVGEFSMFMPLCAVEFIASVPLHVAGVVLCSFIQRSSSPKRANVLFTH